MLVAIDFLVLLDFAAAAEPSVALNHFVGVLVPEFAYIGNVLVYLEVFSLEFLFTPLYKIWTLKMKIFYQNF